MKTQDIQKIIEQAEACKVAIKELQSRTGDAMNNTINDEESDELDRKYGTMANAAVTVLGIGAEAQINEILSLIKIINKK